MKFKSLKIRVLVWFGAVTFAMLLVFSIAFYYFFNRSINTSIRAKLYTKAVLIKNQLSSDTPINKIIRRDFIAPFDMAIIKNGKIIAKTKRFNLQKLKNKIHFILLITEKI